MLRLRFLVFGVLAASGAATATAPADTPPVRAAQVACIDNPLGPAPDWTVIVHGDMVEANTDSEGRVAVGGNATLTNFGVASRMPVDRSRVDLAVGGDLTATNVGVNNGSITYGGTLSGNATAPNGTITKRPLDLDALFQEARRRADGWQTLDPNGTLSEPQSGVLSLTGTNQRLNVFKLPASRLQSANTVRLRVPFGSSILVNVTGNSYSTTVAPTYALEFWNGSAYGQLGNELSGANADELEALRRSLLWNFADAETIRIEAFAWHGSILAPRAAILFNNGQLNGTLIAGSLSGTGETHLHPPGDICLPDIDPEPPRPPVPPPDPPPNPDPDVPVPDEPDTPDTPNTPDQPRRPDAPATPQIPPFADHDQSGQGGVLPAAASSTDIVVTKQIIDRRGRLRELLRTPPGRLVRFRLFGYTRGFASARAVVVCDRFPAELQLVRAPGDPTRRGNELCWRLGTVDTQREAIITFRVRDDVCGRAVNRLTVRSRNGGRHRDTAQVTACRPRTPRITG